MLQLTLKMKHHYVHEKIVEVEIARYLTLPVVEINFDPLQWWKLEEKRLPVLAVLAKKYVT